MRIVRSIQNAPAYRRPTCFTIGTFDGVHLGHQEVIRKVVERASASGLRSAVMTFDPHPRSSLGKAGAPPLLTGTEHKLALLEKLGVDLCVLVDLNDTLASMTAADFVVRILYEKFKIAGIAVGPRLRFGQGRKGTPHLLKKLGQKLGFWVEVVDEVVVEGVPVSSTMVRRSVLHGDLSAAELLLGRPFSILGRVVRGRTLGRKLGYRTANIHPLDQVIPPRGVYAVEVIVKGETHLGALNVGWRPTFSAPDRSPPVLEVHILGFQSRIYQKQVEVVFRRRIRDERRFPTPHELAAQIALDIEKVKRYFHVKSGGGCPRPAADRILVPGKGNC